MIDIFHVYIVKGNRERVMTEMKINYRQNMNKKSTYEELTWREEDGKIMVFYIKE